MMFSLQLKELREKAGYSQYSFANKFGVAQSTVGGWESGKREPNFETTIRLAEFFGVSIDYLLTGRDYRENGIHVSGSISSGAVVQGVNNGSVIVRNGKERILSDEADELLRLYESFEVRRRNKLLNMAFALEEEANANETID